MEKSTNQRLEVPTEKALTPEAQQHCSLAAGETEPQREGQCQHTGHLETGKAAWTPGSWAWKRGNVLQPPILPDPPGVHVGNGS